MNLHNYMERKASFRFKLLSFGTNGMETGPGSLLGLETEFLRG